MSSQANASLALKIPTYFKNLSAQFYTYLSNSYSTSKLAFITPVFSAFMLRLTYLEQESSFGALPLSGDALERLFALTSQRAMRIDEPELETIKMQVEFEYLYAMEIQKKRHRLYLQDKKLQENMRYIMEISDNLSSTSQVALLYRNIFQMIIEHEENNNYDAASSNGNGASGKTKERDRNVEREVAAALESVFPQSHLSIFQLLPVEERKKQIDDLKEIILGIRLFNKNIKKGGAGLVDIPVLATSNVDSLYHQFEQESLHISEISHLYTDVLYGEEAAPGTISSSVIRLQQELLNRRQYLLFLHQLQHEVIESMESIKQQCEKMEEIYEQLRTLVGLRTSVPKEQVYPKFQQLSACWRLLCTERDTNEIRKKLFETLLKYRQSFISNLLEEDLEVVKKKGARPAPAVIDSDEFVETLSASSAAAANNATLSYRPVRLIKENTPNFMALPLEYQGYCPWTLVHHGSLLLPGNPSLGIIRVLGRHYSFVDSKAMQEFCEDPEKYIEGVTRCAIAHPALIHLLCLQPYLTHCDISEFFNVQQMLEADSNNTQQQQQSIGCQTPHYINTNIPDPNYHWNEWDLRRQAIQLADLTKKVTHSTQTNLSHFRRDNSTQYTLPKMRDDGSMAGKGTQTGIEKSTNVERVYRYHANLRGAADQTMRVVQLRIPEHVEDGSNTDLRGNK